MNRHEHHEKITSIRARRDAAIKAFSQEHADGFAKIRETHSAKMEELRAVLAKQAALADVLTEPSRRSKREKQAEIAQLEEIGSDKK